MHTEFGPILANRDSRKNGGAEEMQIQKRPNKKAKEKKLDKTNRLLSLSGRSLLLIQQIDKRKVPKKQGMCNFTLSRWQIYPRHYFIRKEVRKVIGRGVIIRIIRYGQNYTGIRREYTQPNLKLHFSELLKEIKVLK